MSYTPIVPTTLPYQTEFRRKPGIKGDHTLFHALALTWPRNLSYATWEFCDTVFHAERDGSLWWNVWIDDPSSNERPPENRMLRCSNVMTIAEIHSLLCNK